MKAICHLRNATKTYPSGFSLGPIDLDLRSGEIAGLIGKNGSGKTTLIRIILGVLNLDKGLLRFGDNCECHSNSVKGRIGYVDEEPLLYDWMTISWIGWFYSRFFERWNQDRFRAYVHNLEIPIGRSFGDLSRGNKVKVAICCALSAHPDLVLMDEPTSGLDPAVREEILSLLFNYRKIYPQASVLFSSHILGDLERICDRVIFLDEGSILLDRRLHQNPDKHEAGSSGPPHNPLEKEFLEILNRNGTVRAKRLDSEPGTSSHLPNR